MAGPVGLKRGGFHTELAGVAIMHIRYRHQCAAPQRGRQPAEIGRVDPGGHGNQATKKPERVLRPGESVGNGLQHRQQIARALDLGGHLALLLGGEAGVFAGEDLAGVRDEAAHQLRAGVRDLFRLQGLGLRFGRAHGGNGSRKVGFPSAPVNGHFWVANPTERACLGKWLVPVAQMDRARVS